MKKYYEAYDERYKGIHGLNEAWTSDEPTRIVYETISKYGITKKAKMLEDGCGEGRDSAFLLEKGYGLLATDVSGEAIRYNQELFPRFKDNFGVLDVIKDRLDSRFDFIYSVAVIHMLVDDEDRAAFYL